MLSIDIHKFILVKWPGLAQLDPVRPICDEPRIPVGLVEFVGFDECLDIWKNLVFIHTFLKSRLHKVENSQSLISVSIRRLASTEFDSSTGLQ